MDKIIEQGFDYLFTNYNATLVVTFGTFLVHELSYFAWYIPYFIADFVPSLQQYKIQKDKENTYSLQMNCFKRILLLHTLTQIPMMTLAHTVLSAAGMRHEGPIPSWQSILAQILIFFIIEDFWFYWIHRLLHYGWFYKNIHKIHHEHSAPFGIAAEYAHPVESVILGIGTALGPMIIGLYSGIHLITLWVWLVARLWQTVDVHSGYNFPWSPNHFIPFWGGAEFHDHHHMAFLGNYASTFTYCDKLFGTDDRYQAWKKKQSSKEQ